MCLKVEGWCLAHKSLLLIHQAHVLDDRTLWWLQCWSLSARLHSRGMYWRSEPLSPKSEHIRELIISYVKFSKGKMIVTFKRYVQPRVKTNIFPASKLFLSITDHLQATFAPDLSVWQIMSPWKCPEHTNRPKSGRTNWQTNQTLYLCRACVHRIMTWVRSNHKME